jgi:hypothetical protein
VEVQTARTALLLDVKTIGIEGTKTLLGGEGEIGLGVCWGEIGGD